VHADSEATLLADYKTIGKKLGVNEWLVGSDLLAAVRRSIGARSKWVMVLDNADDLRLFGAGQASLFSFWAGTTLPVHLRSRQQPAFYVIENGHRERFIRGVANGLRCTA
jgi:hypothetical protein